MAGEGAWDSFRFAEDALPPTGWLCGAALAGALALLAGAGLFVLSAEAQPDRLAARPSRTINMKLFRIQLSPFVSEQNLSDNTTRSSVHVKLSAGAGPTTLLFASCS
jgi:hypothetical protein